MKTKHIAYSFCLFFAVLWTACEDTEKLENKIDFSSPYVLTDDPNDPIQHHRYLIFKEYGVPVFFNDTVSQTYIADDYDGEPIYRYETLDLNWSFSSHNKDKVKYMIEYYDEEDIENQEKALKFVDAFLGEASKPMRPFSIFLTKSLTKVEENKAPEAFDYWSGFRTLVIPNVQNVAEERIGEFSSEILRSMLIDKVKGTSTVVNEFGEVSNKNKYYDKPWVNENNNGGLGCVWGVVHKGTYWKPSLLYTEAQQKKIVSEWWSSGINTDEEFEAERAIIFQQIGQFGFICGSQSYSQMEDHMRSPKNVSEDMEFYLKTILEIGETEFMNRYGESPLVVKKYNILVNYIKDVLKVNIKE